MQKGVTVTRLHRAVALRYRSGAAAGASPQQIEDALAVAFAFNVTCRLANAFDFTIARPEAMNAGAKYLLKRGYK